MKKILLSILVLISVLTLASCSKARGGAAPEKVALENVWLAEKIALPDVDAYDIIVSGDQYYFRGNKEIEKTDENGEKITNYADVVYHADENLENLKEICVHENNYFWDENTFESRSSYVNFVAPDDKGSVWINITAYHNYPKDPINREEWVNETEITLLKYDKDGNLIRTVEFSKIYKTIEDLSEEEKQNQYINCMFEAPDGNLLVSWSKRIVVIDDKDTVVKSNVFEDGEYYYDFTMLENGNLLTTKYDWSNDVSTVKIMEYDLATNTFEEVLSIETNNGILMGKDGNLYIDNYYTINRIDAETGEETPILDWINSDINCDRIGNITIKDNEIYTFEYDANYENRYLLRLTPAGEGDVVEKYIMTIAANYISSDLKNMIIDYNRSSPEHRITVKAYGWEEGATDKFDLDLLSGNVPDIICLEELDASKYATKGIFADLGAMMDADEDISRDDFLPNVLEAALIKGKLYRMPTAFSVRTLVGKTSLVGEKESWTWDELIRLKNSFPNALLFENSERMTLLDTYLPILIEEFVDYNTGKTNFTSGDFAKFLELVKEYPATIDWEKYYEDIDWEYEEAKYKENRVLLQQSYISTFEGNMYIAQNYGEPVSYIAYPSSSGKSGNAIVFSNQFAIGASSKFKNEAWDFVKMVLSEDYQTNYIYNFPVLKSVFEAKKTEALKNWVEDSEYDDSYIPDDDMAVLPMPRTDDVLVSEDETVEIEVDVEVEELPVEPDASNPIIGMPKPPIYEEEDYLRVTAESIEMVYNIALSANRLVRYNDPVIDIIKSEIEPYFDGKKSIEETCKIIESKVNLYLAENM